MLSKLMDALFGCRHVRYSFPMTVRAGSRRTPTARRTGTYVTCLDCGQEFRYDWQAMKIVGSAAQRSWSLAGHKRSRVTVVEEDPLSPKSEWSAAFGGEN
jgi:RNase P subunit RPR2